MSDTKQAIIDALRAFLATRPGFEPGNYGDAASYRADVRTATRQRHDAERFLRDIELRDSITADDILREAQGGRVSITVTPIYVSGKVAIIPGHHIADKVTVHYTAGQYYCTEYRGAVARLLASVLWAWKRDDDAAQYDVRYASRDDALRASFRREYGRGLASRYFN